MQNGTKVISLLSSNRSIDQLASFYQRTVFYFSLHSAHAPATQTLLQSVICSLVAPRISIAHIFCLLPVLVVML